MFSVSQSDHFSKSCLPTAGKEDLETPPPSLLGSQTLRWLEMAPTLPPPLPGVPGILACTVPSFILSTAHTPADDTVKSHEGQGYTQGTHTLSHSGHGFAAVSVSS